MYIVVHKHPHFVSFCICCSNCSHLCDVFLCIFPDRFTVTAAIIMLWKNGIMSSIIGLMICNNQWKTGCWTGSCTNKNVLIWHIFLYVHPTEHIFILCIPISVGMCAHVWTCIHLPVRIRTYMLGYAWSHMCLSACCNTWWFITYSQPGYFICNYPHFCNFIF